MKKLVVATGNKGKLKEFKSILLGKYEVVSMLEMGFTGDIEETGETFRDNAYIKAKAVSEKLHVDAIADDSGLMVEALGGAPGVYSARFSGEHGDDKANRELLLKKLEGEENRKAKFCSSIVLYKVGGETVEGYGETLGEIMQKEEGENGFGYDSLFFSYDIKKGFGEATDEEKNGVSHRRRALDDLISKL